MLLVPRLMLFVGSSALLLVLGGCQYDSAAYRLYDRDVDYTAPAYSEGDRAGYTLHEPDGPDRPASHAHYYTRGQQAVRGKAGYAGSARSGENTSVVTGLAFFGSDQFRGQFRGRGRGRLRGVGGYGFGGDGLYHRDVGYDYAAYGRGLRGRRGFFGGGAGIGFGHHRDYYYGGFHSCPSCR